MNKFINKALFYKEWINVKWVTVLTIFVLLYFKLFGVISQLNTNKMFMKEQGRVWTDRWFNNGLFIKDNYYLTMIFAVIILSIILFLGEKTSETQGFIVSMPFTRKQIILNKWLVGVFCIIISFVVILIALSLFYAANLYYIDTALNPYSDIIKWFFMDIIFYCSIFTFIMFVQTAMGNSIVAGAVGAIIPLVPIFIISVVKELVMRTSGVTWNNPKLMTFQRFETYLNVYTYNNTEQQWYNIGKHDTDMYRTFYYHNYELKLSLLLIMTVLFLYLAYAFYKKRDLEYNLRLLSFKNLESVFIWGFSICAGLLLGAILGFDYSNEGSNVFLLWGIVGTVGGYFVSKVLVKVFSSSK